MKKDGILGKDGLTITSANHLANIAKEMYEAIENRLESLKLYSKDFLLAVNGNTYRVENESEHVELATMLDDVKRIGALKSLIAYLREGIKAKDALGRDKAFEEHIEELIEAGREDLRQVEAGRDVTLEDELAKLSPEQRARYYALEARCAALGSFIHPDGAFAKARKTFFEHMKNPTTVNGRGQDAEIFTFSSGFTTEEVDGAFFAMQKEYRNLQAEFNGMKAEIEQRVRDANKAMASETVEAMDRWMSARRLERVRYNDEVSALKVVIPQNLREIYEEVNAVASAR